MIILDKEETFEETISGLTSCLSNAENELKIISDKKSLKLEDSKNTFYAHKIINGKFSFGEKNYFANLICKNLSKNNNYQISDKNKFLLSVGYVPKKIILKKSL